MLKYLIWAIVALFLTPFLFGCNMSGMAQQPIQETLDRVFVEVVSPAVEKALSETMTQNFAHQGDLQGIEPGYCIDFEGFWSIGVKGSAAVRATGVAGVLTWNMQASDNPRPDAPVPDGPPEGPPPE